MRLSPSAVLVLSFVTSASLALGALLPPNPQGGLLNRRETGYEDLAELSRRLAGTEVADVTLREPDVLSLRDDDNLLEARDSTMGHTAWQIVKIINHVIHQEVANGTAHHKDFASNFIGKARLVRPGYNWAIVHPKHDKHFDGKQNVDWGWVHTEFDVEIGKVYMYTVYWFGKGEITLEGHGGPIDWAYDGIIDKQSSSGKHVTFGKPPPVKSWL